MSTTPDFIEFVCEQIRDVCEVRFKKMFGEYMVYVNDKPILLVCENTVFVKILPDLTEIMSSAERGSPYEGAKERYILDIDNAEFASEVVSILELITPLPKPRKKK
jgi:TfoX/Sxy family transcriptional regulator of competence genes